MSLERRLTSPTKRAAASDRPPTRRGRKRRETHRRLIDAARVVIADRGVEATTIQEITDAADVGFGTFYNHFESKETLLDEVVGLLIGEFVGEMDELTASIDDPAVAMATVIKNLIRLVDVDPVLCGLAVQIGTTRPELGNAVAGRIRSDLERGMASGRFDIADSRAAIVVIGGALNLAMQLRLEGRLEREDEARHVALVLRMIGLPRAEAETIATGPLPTVTGRSRATPKSPM